MEFGVADGCIDSNTLLLEKQMSWTGIVAEPMSIWHKALGQNRTCKVDFRCVWSSSDEELEFCAMLQFPGLSTLMSYRDCDIHAEKRAIFASALHVKSVSLNDLLFENGAPKQLDYMSVDTEGSEFDILNSLDFDRWKPKIITVEHNFVEEARSRIFHLLTGHGYVREFEVCSQVDDWYCQPEFISDSNHY